MRLLFDHTQNNINATVEIVDEKIVTLKEEVKDLSDFTNIINMPESCGHLKLMGDSKSKTLLVKPDSEGSSEAPIEVSELNFPDQSLSLFVSLFFWGQIVKKGFS